MANLETILSWFQTGDNPTEEEFRQTFSSFRHNDTKILIKDVDGLESSLNNKLNVDDLPANMAVVDEGETSDVFNKEQIMAMTMMLSDYVKNGKIRADKIEAIGLTDLIEAVEKNIVEFAANSEKYEFQQNDFIAVPINENFSLFMFKGGEKKDKNNYLPTGISNVTIAMVEGLQTVLNGKLDKPLADGSFFTKKTGSSTIQKEINPSANYLLFWDGNDFKNSNIYRDFNNGRIGIGTTTPKEQIHLTERARMTGLVLDENTESIPEQITRSGDRFFGTNSRGLKRSFLYKDYDDYISLIDGLTDTQIDAIRVASLKSTESYATGQPRIDIVSPFYIENTKDYPQPIIAIGVNLYLNPVNTIVKLVKVENNVEVLEIDVSDSITTSQTLPNQLCIFKNFFKWSGTYKIKITNSLGLTGQSSFMVTFTDSIVTLPVPKLWLDYDSNPSQTFLKFIDDKVISFNGTGGEVEKTLRIGGLGLLSDDYQHGLGIEMLLNVTNSIGGWENPVDYQLNFGLSSIVSNNFSYDIGDRLNFQNWQGIFYQSLVIPRVYASILSTKVQIYLKNGFWIMYYTSLGAITSGSYSSLDELFLYFKLRNERLSGSLEITKIFKI
ncbi:hypothetical protein [Chryseobacterium sp. Hurlbut01]|jgi:hypothetical protein|uniref:hypothetical protein n=1 Tax=Chryseobacterium sp. Hurlbut01 TaxID=1681828 RepID=UPI00067CC7D2|nr:hypothetical protein [Chryseobacterium sp. Hurlbut01]KNB60046.1 hypothetical protein AC804_12440 [Chryseobacterium sp. Hurlbut01]